MITYSIWHNWPNQSFDIIRCENKQREAVQVNIRTREKAEAALADWRQREAEKSNDE